MSDNLKAIKRLWNYQSGLPWRLKPRFLYHEIHARLTKTRVPYEMISGHAQHPLLVRPYSSDILVFKQVLVDREYACIDDLENISLVIDCGGNVGYSSSYFLSRHPEASCISVEPDLENFKILQKNLQKFGDRSKPIHAGIWSGKTSLRAVNNQYRGGDKWAIQVEECDALTDGAIPGIDVLSILEQSGFDRISILKVDVEGAEVMMFSEGCERWLSLVDNMVIELHDDSCFGPATDVVLRKISQQERFASSRYGELRVFKSIK